MVEAASPLLRCPECGSERLYRDGMRYLSSGEARQRWLCRNCGYRFSEKRFSDNAFKECQTENVNRQVCAVLEEAKNLDNAQETWTCAGERETKQQDAKGKIAKYLWHLGKEGRKLATITARRKVLFRLLKHGADLTNPESVKETIAREQVSVNTKNHYAVAYDGFAKWLGLSWSRPQYKFERKLPFLPTEAELDQLIAGCNRRLAVFLQILKETMARAGEAWMLKWTDINGNILTINAPEKGSLPRQFRISDKLVAMLNSLPRKDERIFGPNMSLANFRTTFIRRRKRIAQQLANPRINKITFHTFRHWGATMLFHKTKNILYVKQQLGHKCIENTMVYTQLLNFESDEWHVAHARTLEEEDKLIQAGFEFVRYNEKEQVAIYRKRK
ncbi:MAG: tyrosine-type recombinase/integrase [Candidatus Bathyarchaeia archaeon]